MLRLCVNNVPKWTINNYFSTNMSYYSDYSVDFRSMLGTYGSTIDSTTGTEVTELHEQ